MSSDGDRVVIKGVGIQRNPLFASGTAPPGGGSGGDDGRDRRESFRPATAMAAATIASTLGSSSGSGGRQRTRGLTVAEAAKARAEERARLATVKSSDGLVEAAPQAPPAALALTDDAPATKSEPAPRRDHPAAAADAGGPQSSSGAGDAAPKTEDEPTSPSAAQGGKRRRTQTRARRLSMLQQGWKLEQSLSNYWDRNMLQIVPILVFGILSALQEVYLLRSLITSAAAEEEAAAAAATAAAAAMNVSVAATVR